MIRKPRWQQWVWSAVLAFALVLTIRSDLAHLDWVAKLSREGSPAPERDATSPTGYVLGQRHFLGSHQRGETYRWIAATQELIASGPWANPTYDADTLPQGRPQLLPRVYAAWLAALSWVGHVLTGEPLARTVEQVALWEPVLVHAVAFMVVVTVMWVRFGAASAGVAGIFLALFPPFSRQFLPGTLTTETWALLFATAAMALALPPPATGRAARPISVLSAGLAGLALWLDPAYGFPAVLILAAAGVFLFLGRQGAQSWIGWSVTGAVLTTIAWLIDQSPWSLAAGELRYVHPLYALAWLGIGLGLDGWQHLRAADRRRAWCVAEIIAAGALVAALAFAQLHNGYKGWLYTSASMRRLTGLDETLAFATILDWLVEVSLAEIMLVAAPSLLALGMLAMAFRRKSGTRDESRATLLLAAILLAGVLAFSLFRIRWFVIASLIALPVIACGAARATTACRQVTLSLAAVLLFGLFAWGKVLPASLQRPGGASPARGPDLEALIYRHFAHWLATHNPGQRVAVLAPPELSDAIIFHGGCRAVMSTAWESYPGQVAASRILSASEASEAEAVLQSLGLTHVILPSWDPVLPLLVQQPDVAGKDTLYARLQHWLHPPYLRAIPYRLPPVPGYLDQKLPVFKVVPPQDEGLSLSRLAEYFLEMDRPEPAGLAAKALAQSFPHDPNAAIARALVYEQAKNTAGFARELDRLAADVAAGRIPALWDRRVQRAIVLAIGGRHDLARAEIVACLAAASEESLFDLTPLQAHRLRTLARSYDAEFPSPELAQLALSLSSEYAVRPAQTSVD